LWENYIFHSWYRDNKVVRPCASDYMLISITVTHSNRCHVMWLVNVDLFSRNPHVHLLFAQTYVFALLNIFEEFFFFSNKVIAFFDYYIMILWDNFYLKSFYFSKLYLKTFEINSMTQLHNWLLQMHSNKERHSLNNKQEN